MTVERCPDNPMLSCHEILDGKPGKYVWQTYKEVYELVIKVGNAMRSFGFGDQTNPWAESWHQKNPTYGIPWQSWIRRWRSTRLWSSYRIC
ncbi:long chain acyl-CoA synthetase 4 [Juglans microcarpa x Juglans regia]|uniref:long chain acyl-CoA synthetase 4 n=1 Tax=Juglans microcarpa x Juglans regia TaxID=2249226 RepID=UPI001B7EE4DA|nr:long chain acyl-CoA synthetase 4 [Juglans microcarpa x Juglans regia]